MISPLSQFASGIEIVIIFEFGSRAVLLFAVCTYRLSGTIESMFEMLIVRVPGYFRATSLIAYLILSFPSLQSDPQLLMDLATKPFPLFEILQRRDVPETQFWGCSNSSDTQASLLQS